MHGVTMKFIVACFDAILLFITSLILQLLNFKPVKIIETSAGFLISSFIFYVTPPTEPVVLRQKETSHIYWKPHFKWQLCEYNKEQL